MMRFIDRKKINKSRIDKKKPRNYFIFRRNGDVSCPYLNRFSLQLRRKRNDVDLFFSFFPLLSLGEKKRKICSFLSISPNYLGVFLVSITANRVHSFFCFFLTHCCCIRSYRKKKTTQSSWWHTLLSVSAFSYIEILSIYL